MTLRKVKAEICETDTSQISAFAFRRRSKRKEEYMSRTDLPEACLSTMPGTGELIVLKRGETG